MITTVLALFSLAASLGEEPPLILSAHKTYAECQNAKQKLLHEKYKEMQQKIAFPACLRVVFEDVGIEQTKEDKGSGE